MCCLQNLSDMQRYIYFLVDDTPVRQDNSLCMLVIIGVTDACT
ncbi:MAG: hypothetical protein ACTS73_02260 [Arsenophonus sp. NEOnobi-MAG3]